MDGKESIGTITMCDENRAYVQWHLSYIHGAITYKYRIGADGYYDLSTGGMYLKPYVESKYKCILYHSMIYFKRISKVLLYVHTGNNPF